jgi:hypothetical protein
MAGVLFILVSFALGYSLLNLFYTRNKLKTFLTLKGEQVLFPLWFFELAASFIIGTSFLTFATYYTSYIAKSSSTPLLYGNTISLIIASAFSSFIFYKYKSHKNFQRINQKSLFSNKIELSILFFVLILFTIFFYYSFNIDGNNLKVGFSVHGDFGPHIAMIRSFSWGDNFPTQYPHFPDGTVRYHFMFQFLIGNLEYLGLPIYTAFNIMSIFAMTALVMLLYLLTYVISGSKTAGILTNIMFFFRSGFAIFYFIGDLAEKKLPSLKSWINELMNNRTYIGKTVHEDWGLYTQNVYANQRHLAFGISSMLIMLIIFYPLFQRMITARYRDMFLKADSWLFEDPKRAIFTGLLIGVCSFFNGAVLISGLLILFFLAIFSKNKLEHLVTAIIGIGFFYAQVNFFTGGVSTTNDTGVFIGYLANIPSEVASKMNILFNEDKSYFKGLIESFNAIPYIIVFYIKLLGIFPLVLIASFYIVPKKSLWLCMAFSSPLVFASTVKLTPDINVNHKYIMISIILLNIFVAILLTKIFEYKKLYVLAGSLVFVLTITGLYDFVTYFNINKNSVSYKIDDPIVEWIKDNTPKDSIFFSHYSVLNPPLIAGRPIYYGWPYYAWSAGYKSDHREKQFMEICESNDAESLIKLLKENKISYIYVDKDISENKDYKLNTAIFLNTLKVVYPENSNFIYNNNTDNVKILKVE